MRNQRQLILEALDPSLAVPPHKKLYIGFAGYFATRLFTDKPRARRLAELLLNKRWPWPLTSVVYGLQSSFLQRSRRARLPSKDGMRRLEAGIVHTEHREACLDHRADAELNHAKICIETGQRLVEPEQPCAASVTGMTRAFGLPEGTDVLSWVELMHELMLTLDVGNAVLPVWRTENMVWSDTTFGGIVLDNPKSVYNLGLRGVFETQRSRANYWRHELGGKYIRHPRWGTYVRRELLDRVDGLQRIRDTVPLAKVLELGGAGDLIYLQCTEHPEGAMTVEGEGVRHALEQVLAPIIVPPRPQEQAAT